MRFLFIHGGPGFNSNPEKHLLTELFSQNGDELLLWNEPSPQRSSGTNHVEFKDLCESLEKTITEVSKDGPVIVLAHSFGALVLNQILPAIGERIAAIVLISPATDLFSADLKILEVSKKDLHGSAEAEVLAESIRTLKPGANFSPLRQNALMTAAGNANLTSHYWFKKTAMPSYYEYFNGPQYQFNLDSFFSIRNSCASDTIKQTTETPTAVIYGRHDFVVLPDEFDGLKKFYPNSSINIFEESGHYAHIEEPDKFLRLCKSLTNMSRVKLSEVTSRP